MHEKATTFLNGMWATVSIGIVYNWQFSMEVWLIAWLETLAVVRLTDGKLNSRQMPPPPPPTPVSPSYPLHELNTPTLTSLCPRLCCPLPCLLYMLFLSCLSSLSSIHFAGLTVFCLNFESFSIIIVTFLLTVKVWAVFQPSIVNSSSWLSYA